MRSVVVALALVACADAAPRPRVSYPTLEPDGRIGAAPIDPYGPESELRGIVGEIFPTTPQWGDPGAVTRMLVRVQTDGLRLPSTPNHHVVVDRDQLQHLTVQVGPGAVVTPAERSAALHSTAEIDAHRPAIRRAAREATSGARTDRQKVAALVTWVHSHITYVHADETVASVVLARGSGDCSEMSLLFVALARAVGVPAREVSGLAATEHDGEPAFGLHGWAEVALDGRWVQVDPTWNEPVADATHVMLEEGPGHEWTRAVDHLRVAVDDLHHDRRLVGHADVRQLASELPSYMRLRRK